MLFHSLEENPEYINLQVEMVRLQRWVMEKNKRIVVLFEGRDTAGKGGAIMRFARFINPRGYRIVALNKPTKQEKGQWYFQRYLKELPNPGEIVFFDRSWYNRAVVEPVMGFCKPQQYKTFMEQVPALEDMLIDDGIILIKLWFSIDLTEQERRIKLRETEPLQQWKLSAVDMQAQENWDVYTEYKEKMFAQTSSLKSPWVVIKSNDKDSARLEAMRYVLNIIDYPLKGDTGERLEPLQDVIQLHTGSKRYASKAPKEAL